MPTRSPVTFIHMCFCSKACSGPRSIAQNGMALLLTTQFRLLNSDHMPGNRVKVLYVPNFPRVPIFLPVLL